MKGHARRKAPAPTGEVAPRPADAPSLPILRARWRIAFEAAQSALAAATPLLAPSELTLYSKRLTSERPATARLLEAYAREQHANISGGRLLLAPRDAKRALPLPFDIRACIFNLDGVLVGSDAVHAAAWTEAFDSFGAAWETHTGATIAPFNPRTDYRAHLRGKPRLEGIRTFLASRGIRLAEGHPSDPPETPTVHGLANFKNAVLQRLLDATGVAPYAGAREYLEIARDAGLRSAVVSASANTVTLVERAGLATLVDGYVDGNLIAAKNIPPLPKPDVLCEACEVIGADARHAAAFETSPAGIDAACAGGFGFVVGIDHAGNLGALRAAGADLVATNLEGLLEIERAPA